MQTNQFGIIGSDDIEEEGYISHILGVSKEEADEIIEYLKNPPTAEVLADMIQQAGLSVREAIRQNVTPYETLQLAERDLSDAELIALMVQHPLLINRPFVVTERGVKLCRPSELVLDLLTQPQLKAFRKEDGELVIDEHGQRVN